jgi:hypothetical protein
MDDLTRWMYRGGRPNRLARLLNGISAKLFAGGHVLPGRAATLQVRGRRTGQIVALPVVIAEYHGQRYLVAMLGEQTNWVRNLRACGGRAVLAHGRREEIRLVDVPVEQRGPILRRYLDLAPGARPHLPVDRHAPVAEFDAIADRYPVFMITAVRPVAPATGS